MIAVTGEGWPLRRRANAREQRRPVIQPAGLGLAHSRRDATVSKPTSFQYLAATGSTRTRASRPPNYSFDRSQQMPVVLSIGSFAQCDMESYA